MPLTIGSIAGYLLTAGASASLGFMTNGMMGAGKVSELYHRLDRIESMYAQQAILLQDMSKILREMGAEASIPPAAGDILAHVDHMLSRQ